MNEKLHAIFQRLFSLDQLHPGLSMETVEGWNSFSHISLILELEEAFGLAIPTSQAVNLVSLGEIESYIAAQKEG